MTTIAIETFRYTNSQAPCLCCRLFTLPSGLGVPPSSARPDTLGFGTFCDTLLLMTNLDSPLQVPYHLVWPFSVDQQDGKYADKRNAADPKDPKFVLPWRE